MTFDFPDRALSTKEVCSMVGMSRINIWDLQRVGKFPARRRVRRKTYWLQSEILSWLQDQPKVEPQEA